MRNVFLALILPLACTLSAEDASPLLPGQAALLKGKITMKQEYKGEVVDEMSLTATLLTITENADSAAATPNVIVVRTQTSEEGTLSAIDRILLKEDTSIDRVQERPLETAEAGGGLNDLYSVKVFADFEVPTSETEVRKEQDLPLLYQATTKGPAVTKKAADSSKLTISRVLAAGATPVVDGLGSPGKLTEFFERYVYDRNRGVPETISKALKLSVAVGEEPDDVVVLTMSLELRVTEVLRPGDENASKLQETLQALTAISAAFESQKKVDVVAKQVAALKKSIEDTPLASLSVALKSHVDVYKKIFDAPDFKLSGLDGKEVSFRELTKGKPTLLNFWGVG